MAKRPGEAGGEVGRAGEEIEDLALEGRERGEMEQA